MKNLTPVILCGGSGTRLWPVSRTSLPKQYCDFFGVNLFRETLARFASSPEVVVVSTAAQLPLLQRFGGPEDRSRLATVLEPVGRNTAAAVAIAAYRFLDSPSRVLGVFPADHHIADREKFLEAVDSAAIEARRGAIATLGIRPTYPATGYGYIETKGPSEGRAYLDAVRFHEKPDAERAAEYLASGRFFWNAGIFVARVDRLVDAFETHAPDLWAAVRKIIDPNRPTAEEYAAIPALSFDVAIMEKLAHHACVPVDCGWSDVGSWDSLIATFGGGRAESDRAIRIGSEPSVVMPYRDREYALIDCPDVNVIDTADALLVYRTGSSEKVKAVHEKLKARRSPTTDSQPLEYRPWGQFEILRDTDAFKSKVIQVLPGQRLSYQSHTRRAEHWIIVRGKPEVTLDGATLKPGPGEHVYIPVGAKHRIANPGTEVVEFVEVQVGTYFGEDDIVRYQDDYERK